MNDFEIPLPESFPSMYVSERLVSSAKNERVPAEHKVRLLSLFQVTPLNINATSMNHR